MMKRILAALGAMAVLAAPAAAESCATTSSESISFGDNVIIEAVAIGDKCEHSVIVLIMREGDGAPLYTYSSASRFLFGFEEVTNEREMAEALDELVGVPMQDGGVFKSSDLPDWEEGADYPGGEFPFFPEEWVDRAEYQRLQGLNLPTYCHVQGMESAACLVLEEDVPFMIGVQLFPG